MAQAFQPDIIWQWHRIVSANQKEAGKTVPSRRSVNGGSGISKTTTGQRYHTFLKDHSKRLIFSESAPIKLLIGAVSFCANNKKRQHFFTVFIPEVPTSVINHHVTCRLDHWRSIVCPDFDVCLKNMTNVISFQF